MKILLFAILNFVLLINTAQAYEQTKGHFRKNGSYVQPHFKTKSDSTRIDNFSTKGNTNPFTGKKGYNNPIKLRKR